MTEIVSNQYRDEIIAEVLSYPENNVCFDCGNKNPTWASVYLGVLLCFDCAGTHRSYGTHISFIRSINLDKWKKNQLKTMELTGNRFVRERFNELGVPKVSGKFDYFSEFVQKFKNDLANKVKEILSQSETTTGAETEVQKKEPVATAGQIKFEDNSNENKNITPEVTQNVETAKEEIYKEPTKFDKFTTNEQKNEPKLSKTNKIKKMDVDFDFDFDNFDDTSFSAVTNPANNTKAEKKTTKQNQNENDLDDEDFGNSYSNTSKKSKVSQEEINKKFANKKAISSEDYANLDKDPYEDKANSSKLKGMKNSQAISSSDIFGQKEEERNDSNLSNRFKDMAIGWTLNVAEKAKELKDKTSSMINRIQNKYGN